MQEFFDQFELLRKRRQPAALATVVGVNGGSSKRLGARLWVTEDGETFGSLTVGGCVDGRARDEAPHVLSEGTSRRLQIDLGEDGPDFGMSCAGTVDVFIQRIDFSSPPSGIVDALGRVRSDVADGRASVLGTPLEDGAASFLISVDDAPMEVRTGVTGSRRSTGACVARANDRSDVLYQWFLPPPLLVVVGTAPVTQPLVRLGKMVGFRVLVIDGTSERLTQNRYPEADDLLVGIPSEICGRLSLTDRSAVVLTVHDYRYEVPVLKEVLQQPAGYVGFVASRRRGGAVLDFLASAGVDADALKRVHVPVGLDIGAMSPAEIAVSIMAEILAVRAGATCLPLVDLPNPVSATAGDLISPVSVGRID